MFRKRTCAYVLLLAMLLTNTLGVQWNNGAVKIVENKADVTAEAKTVQTAEGEEITIRGSFGAGFEWGTTEDNKTLYICGTGDMYNFTEGSDRAPWADEADWFETVIIEGDVTSIGDYAFAQFHNMTKLVLPETVTRIGNYAFDNCYSWTNFDMTGIESIGSGAFQYCGFTSVEIPESVEAMGVRVFYECPNVTGYHVVTGSALYFSDAQGALFSKDNNSMMAYPKASEYVETYTIPEGIISLEDRVFANTQIDTVVFPSSMTVIDDGACADNNFVTVTIPNTVTRIGQGAFRSSNKLVTVTVPGSVSMIEQGAFGGIETLEEVILEDGVEFLHDYAFQDNANLEAITIPASVSNISQFAFHNTNEAVVIKGFTNSTAELYANQYGYTFESIGTVELEAMASGTCGAEGEEESVVWTLYTNGLLLISGEGDMAEFTEYGDTRAPWLDEAYRMKIVNVVIEEGVTSIGAWAFDYCEALIDVEIADSVTSIGARAFKDTRWANPVVPKNVTELGSGAFHIPAEFLNSLSVEEGNTSYVIFEGGLYDAEKTILYKWGLGDAFEDGEFEVVLPSTVKTIGIDAFCGGIVSSVILNEGLETIEERAFYNEHRMTALHIPSTVTYIGKDALYIDNIKAYTVEKGNKDYWADERGALFSRDKKILYYYPSGCTERFYEVPNGVDTICESLCKTNYLEGILIPPSVKNIERTEMELYNPYSLDNRHILIYGHKNSYAETYANTYQYKTWNQYHEEEWHDHEFLVIPTKEFKRLKIHCPVDVYVYDEQGNVVASVVNEQVMVYDETIYADEMVKTVYLENGTDFTVEIVATDEGTVSYTIEEVTETADGSEVTNVVEFFDIPIVAEDTIVSDITMLADAEEYLVNKNNGAISADTVQIVTPDPTPEVTPDPTPEVTPDPTPEVTPDPTPEVTPDPTPEVTPDPTPEVTPTTAPSATPTTAPSATPTTAPSATPTTAPSAIPTATPEPTATPTPTPRPTAIPVPPPASREEIEACLYNGEYYALANEDVAVALNNDPAKLYEHWLNFGKAEGRSASLVFDAKYYLEVNPDVAALVGEDCVAAYEHFVNYGLEEGRESSPVFNVKYYLRTNTDVAEAFAYNYVKAANHFNTNALAEGRSGSGNFDYTVYRFCNTDVADLYGEETRGYYIHYINHGRAEGRTAGFGTNEEIVIDTNAVSYRIFDKDYYLENYPALARTVGTTEDALYRYWLSEGIALGHVASPVFNPTEYLQINTDVAEAVGNDLAAATSHFLTYGIYEGRTGVWAFDYTVYKYCNTDVVEVFGEDIVGYYFHYVKYGRAEGRTAKIY